MRFDLYKTNPNIKGCGKELSGSGECPRFREALSPVRPLPGRLHLSAGNYLINSRENFLWNLQALGNQNFPREPSGELNIINGKREPVFRRSLQYRSSQTFHGRDPFLKVFKFLTPTQPNLTIYFWSGVKIITLGKFPVYNYIFILYTLIYNSKSYCAATRLFSLKLKIR